MLRIWLIFDAFPPVRTTMPCMTRTRVLVGLGAALSVTQILAASPECQPPTEPAEREVKVPLRAGGHAGRRLEQEFERLKVKSTIRPSLPQDLVSGACRPGLIFVHFVLRYLCITSI